MKTTEINIEERARRLRALVFDWDGVFTDNTEIIGLASGEILKSRSHYDGQGISLLRAIGMKIMINTNAAGPAALGVRQLVEKWNVLPSTQGKNPWTPVKLQTAENLVVLDKVAATKEWLEGLSIPASECGVMGDDVVDAPLFDFVGFCAAPITAEQVIREKAHFVSERPGGNGAVRDLANYILKVKGIDPLTLSPY